MENRRKKQLTESQLKSYVRKMVIKEFRDSMDDGDDNYISPRENSIDNRLKKTSHGLSIYTYGKEKGKRARDDKHSPDHDNTELYGSNEFRNGKAAMIGDLADEYTKLCEEFFEKYSKVEWTEEEKYSIEDLRYKLLDIASKTKETGNKKRGYMGDTNSEN